MYMYASPPVMTNSLTTCNGIQFIIYMPSTCTYIDNIQGEYMYIHVHVFYNIQANCMELHVNMCLQQIGDLLCTPGLRPILVTLERDPSPLSPNAQTRKCSDQENHLMPPLRTSLTFDCESESSRLSRSPIRRPDRPTSSHRTQRWV